MDKKILFQYFLEFGAEHNLDESHIEKLERVLHIIRPASMTAVKKICNYIVKRDLQNLPEDEIIDLLKEAKLSD